MIINGMENDMIGNKNIICELNVGIGKTREYYDNGLLKFDGEY